MRKLTREIYEESAKSHRSLWRWVAENPEKKKSYHPNKKINELPFQCFACHIRNVQIGNTEHSVGSCRNHCPIINFRCGRNNCAEYAEISMNYHSLYEKARQKYHYEIFIGKTENIHIRNEVVKYATLIAELPWFDYDYYVLLDNCLVYDFDIEMAKQHRVVEFKY